MPEKQKKLQKEESIRRGDLVEASDVFDSFIGVFLGEEDGFYYVLSKGDNIPQTLTTAQWSLRKTGDHIDLDSVFH